MIYLPKSFRVASLALGQSYDCPSATEVTLKDTWIKSTITKPQQDTPHLNKVHGFETFYVYQTI